MTGSRLCDARAGDRVRVDAMGLERRLTRRLAALGLTPGVDVVVAQAGRGRTVVSARGSRIALGRPVTERIQVTLLETSAS